MRRSTDRILTTHTGSLPRRDDVLEMIQSHLAGDAYPDEFYTRVTSAIDEVVRKQVEAGIDIISDGEQSKSNFVVYLRDRLSGLDGMRPGRRPFADRDAFPEWFATTPAGPTSVNSNRPLCDAPLAWKDFDAVERDIANIKSAAAKAGAPEAFLTTVSIGIFTEIMNNDYYPSEEAYVYAIADVLKREYEAIAAAGLIVQIDAPDAALGKHTQFRNDSLETFRKALALRVEAQNYALKKVPPEQVRYHVCWGNYEGPHIYDVALNDIIDLVLKVNAAAYSIEAANPRHEHEWHLWEDVKLPEGKILIPGVIDSTNNYVEHPELVAERIVNFASLVGRENVIASTDCGFSTSAGRGRVHPTIVWPKLQSLAEGARIATQRLWRK